MPELPEPMTQPECDLTDYPWMPLNILKITKSKAWSICKRQPQLGFYMMNLWMSAWHNVPAASLDDDDDTLCDAAMCDPKSWPKVREIVLRNWVKCSDGRLYHATLAEEALSSWDKKVVQKRRSKAGNDARWGNKGSGGAGGSADDIPPRTPPGTPPGWISEPERNAESSPEGILKGCEKDASSIPKGCDGDPLTIPPDQTRPNQTRQEDSEASPLATAGAAPRDARQQLWTDGLVTLRALTGRSDAQSRAFLGRFLRDLRDDCATALAILDEAADLRPVQPEAWLTAAAKARSGQRSAQKGSAWDEQMRQVDELFGVDAEPEVMTYAH